MRQSAGSLLFTLVATFCCGMLAPAPPRCGVTITLDAEVLNELLPSLAPREVVVPLGAGHSLTVGLEGLKVTGFDPAVEGPGHILTAVTLRVPQMGLVLPVAPRLSVRVVPEGEDSFLELRFEQVPLKLPLAGSINLAAFLAPLRFPAGGESQLEGASAGTSVRSRVVSVLVGGEGLRLSVDLDVVSAPSR